MQLMNHHRIEVAQGQRFEFGSNWSRFLRQLSKKQIELAQESLKSMLGIESLEGKTFVDIGSGSGLFSLAARRLGAKVHSFDFDPKSVHCTQELRRRYFNQDANWTIEEASALHEDYIQKLGLFDVVYSWGVLHHTGDMWKGLDNASKLVAEGGMLFVAIYNDQGRPSHRWLNIKKAYNRLPAGLRWLVIIPSFIRIWGPTTLRDLVKGRPFETWNRYSEERMRGMNPWYDFIDWIGGLPFEVAKPEQIFDFYRARGFILEKITTCAGGVGCNEFVFRREK